MLFIALFFLVEPVLRTGEILRPLAEVDLPAPGFVVGVVPVAFRRFPREVSAALPGQAFVHAHVALLRPTVGDLPAGLKRKCRARPGSSPNRGDLSIGQGRREMRWGGSPVRGAPDRPEGVVQNWVWGGRVRHARESVTRPALTRLIVEPPILTGRGSDRLPGVPTSDIEG